MARLFFALLPRAADRASLHALAGAVAAEHGARPLPGADLHMTLCFLGEVDAARSEAVLRRLALSSGPRLQLDTLDYWPRPRVLCALPDGDDMRVTGLAATIRAELRAAGIGFDGKPFRAHVTLARRPGRSAETLAWPRRLERPLEVQFDTLALLESRRGVPPGEPRYAIVASRSLSGVD